MKLYTFTGVTPSQALQKAQNACGEDALVVNTKMIHKKTLIKEGLYEIVVALEDRKTVTNKKPVLDKELISNIKKSVAQSATIDKLSITNNNKNSSKEINELKASLDSINSRMLELQDILLKSETNHEFLVPPEFISIFNSLKKAGVKPLHIKEIISESIKYMPTYMKDKDETIERYFRVLLKKMLPIRHEFKLKKQKIIMLVGPTGVGKTTSLAKLAARYSFLDYNYKVGIITLDTYRIGAVEQLYQYAKMMKLPIEDLIDPDDFEKALKRFVNMDIILIDSAGSSQNDRDKMKKLKNFIDTTNLKIDINLVVSANAKLEDLEDIVESFSFLDIDTLMVTKFDETKNFGNIFSLIKDTKLPLSYFLDGQEVPDDIRLANGEFLVNCLLEGFKK